MEQNNTKSKITVNEAASIMGVTPQFLRLGLQQSRFPFGAAVKMKRWSYYINYKSFFDYIQKDTYSF